MKAQGYACYLAAEDVGFDIIVDREDNKPIRFAVCGRNFWSGVGGTGVESFVFKLPAEGTKQDFLALVIRKQVGDLDKSGKFWATGTVIIPSEVIERMIEAGMVKPYSWGKAKDRCKGQLSQVKVEGINISEVLIQPNYGKVKPRWSLTHLLEAWGLIELKEIDIDKYMPREI
jgi:hypothetical protein